MYTLSIRPIHNISDFLGARVDVCRRIGTFSQNIIREAYVKAIRCSVTATLRNIKMTKYNLDTT